MVAYWLRETSPATAYAEGAMPASLADAQALMQRYRVADLLPYEAYDDATGLFYGEDAVGFMLELLPAAGGLSENQARVMNGLFTQGLPEGTVIQFLLYASPDIDPMLKAWVDARTEGGIYRHLAERRAAYFRPANWQSLLSGQSLLLRHFRLFMTVSRPLPTNAGEEVGRLVIEWLQRTRASALGTLQSAEMVAWTADAGAFINFLDTILNPALHHPRQLLWQCNKPLREQVVAPDSLLQVGRDSFALIHEGVPVEVIPFSVRQYPREWPAHRMAELIGDFYANTQRFGGPFLMTTTIHVPDAVDAESKARMKAVRATQMAGSPMGRFIPAWRERQEEWATTGKLLDAGHRILNSHFQLVLFARAGEAEQVCQQAQGLFSAKGWSLSRDRFMPLPAFLSALPLMCGPAFVSEMSRMGRFSTFLTNSVTNTLPLVAEWQGNRQPLLLLVGRRGQVMHFDPFANEKGNFNIAVAATSGAGKSFLTQELVTSLLGTGGRCWVIDSGRSYEQLCHLVGGEFIAFSDQRSIRLNPFTWVQRMDMEMPQLKDLLALMASPSMPLDALQKAYLEEAIQHEWGQQGNDGEIAGVAQWLEQHTDRAANEVGQMLYPYAKGTYARIFRGKANINLDNPFVVLELGELDSKPDLQQVVLLLLIMQITEAMYLGNRSQRKLCIIDEAWRLMGSGNAGEFVERGYRTARKFGGAFMTITQALGDYHASSTAQAALQNSDWVLLLRQKPETIAAAEKHGHMLMDGGLKRLLLSLDTQAGKYSEVAIRGPNGTAVGRLIVDPFTEKLYSTKAQEVQAIRDMQTAGLSLADALERLVASAQRH